MRPSSALPNKTMAWIVVPLFIAPLAYSIEFWPVLFPRSPNPELTLLEGIVGWYFLCLIAAIPAYVLGIPVAWLLERLHLPGYIAFGVAGAITAGLFIAAIDFHSNPGGFIRGLVEKKFYYLAATGALNGALFALLLRWVAGWRRRLPVSSDNERAGTSN